jgi:uroporphyrinogen-III synthase
MKRLLVLRPEPGNRATIDRAKAMGLDPLSCPLFSTQPVLWTAPDPRHFDALLFTSANALRHGGEALAALTTLPALAVGPATADAARSSGFNVTMTGSEDVDALLEALPGSQRLLHLTGADHRHPETRHAVQPVIVYASVALEAAIIPSGDFVALVHSPRAGARLAALAPDRAKISIAAISARAAAACGPGWAATAVSEQPNDSALLAVAARLCQD